jgi:hypothetical protein
MAFVQNEFNLFNGLLGRVLHPWSDPSASIYFYISLYVIERILKSKVTQLEFRAMALGAQVMQLKRHFQ